MPRLDRARHRCIGHDAVRIVQALERLDVPSPHDRIVTSEEAIRAVGVHLPMAGIRVVKVVGVAAREGRTAESLDVSDHDGLLRSGATHLERRVFAAYEGHRGLVGQRAGLGHPAIAVDRISQVIAARIVDGPDLVKHEHRMGRYGQFGGDE